MFFLGCYKWCQSNLVAPCGAKTLHDVDRDKDVGDLMRDIITPQSHIEKMNCPHKMSGL